MTDMQLIAVNVGKAQVIPGHKAPTGICKHPAPTAVMIAPLGLEHDAVMDTKNHGGPDQAVYIYGQPDYDFFAQHTGRTFPPGLFGENLTIAGLESQQINIGDRFEIGETLLEATSPRIPCATFAARMEDPKWVKLFFAVNRPGVYVRVLRTGKVEAGMAVKHIPHPGERIPLIELMTDYKKPAPDRMRWLLKTPLHRDLRAKYEVALAQGSLGI